jgi:ribosomal protein S18 acetylase RimI-like enzyme
MTLELRRLTQSDLPRLRQSWKENWGDEFVIAHGVIYHPDTLDGFFAFDAGEWIGEITFHFSGNDCEIVSLDSLRQGQGIGTLLIDKAVEEASARGCQRIFLITTNDNLNALGFYQKRGFELVAVHRGAVNESRKVKPGIPLIGNDGIPLRDEIELEMSLPRRAESR